MKTMKATLTWQIYLKKTVEDVPDPKTKINLEGEDEVIFKQELTPLINMAAIEEEGFPFPMPIELTSNTPINQKAFRLPGRQSDELQETVDVLHKT
jgi:hypothetical protein